MDESDTNTTVKEFVPSLLTPNNNEEVLLNKLQGLVTNIKWSPTDAVDLFDALLKRFESTTNDRSHLLTWLLEMLHCIEINYITPSWRCQTGKTLKELVPDKTVTDEDLKRHLADDTEKKLKEILEEIRQQKLNQIDEKLLDDVRDIVSSVDEDLTLPNNGSQWSGLKKDLLKLCQAAEKTCFRPRLTQMVSWCIMALSKTGRLIQVGTGEGKSCIVAMFAAFRAMRGEKVDIMSSSSVLAERDMKEWQCFYKALNITVNCNTNKQGKDNLKKCYKCQVVYGTVEQFAGDWLRNHFERMDIFGQRTFQCAIVDEVDSLMLDKGLHVVYIGSDMPALQHLNPLLAFIWATANQYSKIGTETVVGQKYPFNQVVLENITKDKDAEEFTILQMAEDTGILAKGSVRDLRKNPSLLTEKTASVTANQLAEFFKTVERRFPSCQFALHCMNSDGAIEELNKGPQKEMPERQRVPLLLINGGFCQYMYSDKNSIQRAAEAEIKRALHFTPCELSKDKRRCYVPGFLSDLVKSKLKVWIENAFYAQTMTMDHEYIMEKHGVVPVDYSCTGVVENNMQWSDGLHQFLEMKHESKLSDMTAITNYMSSVGLLQKYGDQIFGISGTLGQQAETETLQKIYEGIKTCQIPSFKRRKLFEVEGVIVNGEKEWIEKICHVVTAQTNCTPCRAQRAVLVICETINRAKIVHQALGDRVLNKKLYISNNVDNTAVIAKTLEAGEVIIATNLAGRGTDLKVSEPVNTAGGLFVVQTFLPKNARVEAQAFGRTARQGSPGSAQLIVCSSHLSEPLQLLVLTNKLISLLENITDVTPLFQGCFVMQLRLYQKRHSDEQSKDINSTLSRILAENSNSGIKTVKKIRDDSVAEELASYLECGIPKIKKEEELFSQYLNILDEVYKSSNNKPADSYLSALNEFWGMWLLINFNVNESIVDLKNKLTEDLKTARQKLRQRESPSSNLHHYTAFGNELRENGHLAESIKMYTKAIQEDHCWAAIAHYNRAFASLAQQDRHQDRSCIDQALGDLQNALKSVEFYCEQIEVTHKYSLQAKGLCSDSLTRFDSHIIHKYKVLLCFKGNINEAIQKVDRARDTGGNVKVEESPVYFLVPVVHFLPLVVLSTESLTLSRSIDPLKIQQLISHPFFDILNELTCLKSLGLTHVYTLDTLLGGFFSRIHRKIRQAFGRHSALE
ncbi:protein translocase subunit SecA 2-like [Siniperca chuatsi]|uniref:protein translocase subunit SecA 2-like n=1 Tax=Siniperca chuatsi TaxID=119488 RepID=UPI001CE0ADF3|nr:protein translocase subunit SecA 2-like [Siniperca chuatsi]